VVINGVFLCVITVSVVMLNVVMLSNVFQKAIRVMAPQNILKHMNFKQKKFYNIVLSSLGSLLSDFVKQD
jgi:hypothetical protein